MIRNVSFQRGRLVEPLVDAAELGSACNANTAVGEIVGLLAQDGSAPATAHGPIERDLPSESPQMSRTIKC